MKRLIVVLVLLFITTAGAIATELEDGAVFHMQKAWLQSTWSGSFPPEVVEELAASLWEYRDGRIVMIEDEQEFVSIELVGPAPELGENVHLYDTDGSLVIVKELPDGRIIILDDHRPAVEGVATFFGLSMEEAEAETKAMRDEAGPMFVEAP